MDNNIFAAALGITEPWFIENLSFDAEKQLLSVHIDFNKGSRFSCPEMAGDHPIYDSRIKRYRHLNFFQQLNNRKTWLQLLLFLTPPSLMPG